MADSLDKRIYTGSNDRSSSHAPEGRYQTVCLISDGSGGMVCHARDRVTSSLVIVKRVLFESSSLQQTTRDWGLLKQLDHENLCAFRGAVQCQTDGTDRRQHFLVVQEILDMDLRSAIQSGQLFAGHCKLFTYQLLRGLKYLHSADLYHGDLTPDAVQINRKNLILKIGDVAFRRKVKSADSCVWYSSPESIISRKDCGAASDVWSVGCIVAEMATGQPFFQGNGRLEQLLKYIDSVHLTEEDWRKVLSVMPNKMLKNHPFRPRRPLGSQLAGYDPQMVQLVDCLLLFGHQQRITAEESLTQPYLDELYYPDDEPVAVLPFRLAEDKKVDDFADASLRAFLTSLSLSSNVSSLQSGATHVQDQPSSSSSIQRSISHVSTQPENSSIKATDSYKPDDFRQSEHEVALKNLRNNQDRIGGDRTPSPNILDLLNQSFESDHGVYTPSAVKGLSGKLQEADSENEKETAEISEEKLQEDIEIGNITTEDLKKLGKDRVTSLAVHRPVSLPMKSSVVQESVNIAALGCSSLVIRRECQKLIKSDAVLETPTDKGLFVADLKPLLGVDVTEFSKSKDHKNLHASSKSSLQPPVVFLNVPEDSNKYHFDDSDEKQKMKSHSESVRLSRKLLLDKIESEKKSQQMMSPMTGDLTSEEFDELYRLPTEHLRKDKSQNERVRQRHSHEWPRCGRHPDDASDRYSSFYREAEGACGGHDYYDDMQASLSRSNIEFDLEPYFHELVLERSQTLSHDEPELSTELRLIRSTGQGVSANRDTSSSPESPASPRTIQTGARPKKSPKKHRAI